MLSVRCQAVDNEQIIFDVDSAETRRVTPANIVLIITTLVIAGGGRNYSELEKYFTRSISGGILSIILCVGISYRCRFLLTDSISDC